MACKATARFGPLMMSSTKVLMVGSRPRVKVGLVLLSAEFQPLILRGCLQSHFHHGYSINNSVSNCWNWWNKYPRAAFGFRKT